MNVGLVLEDNKEYADGKGHKYYIDYVMNRSSIRQWSLTKLADYGFDSETGIWAECPDTAVSSSMTTRTSPISLTTICNMTW